MTYGDAMSDTKPIGDFMSDTKPIGDYQVTCTTEIVVPDLEGIGSNFSLDFISCESPMKRCDEPLVAVAKQALRSLHLFYLLRAGDSAVKLLSFIRRIADGYEDSGYHCKAHAADVTNRLSCLLKHSGIISAAKQSTMQGHQLLAAVVGACVHDFEHPQVTNNFLVATEQPMAVAFNYQAVIENHSLRSSLALMLQPEYDFMSDWEDDEQKKEFRHNLIRNVLATDMSRHFELLVQYKTKVLRSESLAGKTGSPAWQAMDYSQRTLTLQIAMKVADLGHCMLPIPQHRKWVEALQEEMFRQGDRERDLYMPISPLMDRNKIGVCAGSSQVGFFEVIVLPLIELWTDLFPGCNDLLRKAQENLEYWREQQEQEAASEGSRLQSRRKSLPQRVVI
uniref:3',5'-cyclic-nucleotide phosphodiesterase n=1 Tax=Tetraselmis sp. GSL018 TaxID=582737 RepID=A0A061RQ44_9CHLO